MKYPYDNINGCKVPPLVVSSDYDLTGTHAGSVYVESGKLTISGVLQGSLYVQSGACALINGQQHGSVHIDGGAEVIVTGSIRGSTNLSAGSLLVIEQDGILAGSLQNQGKVILRGLFGGSRNGSGLFRIEGGRIKQPTIKNGIDYYEW